MKEEFILFLRKENRIMIKPEKLSPETIFNTLIPCLPMDSLYGQFESFISEIINQIYSFKFSGNNKEDLKRFLRLQISKNLIIKI